MSEFPDVNKYGMCVDQVGEKFLSILQAVGLPTVVIAVVGMTDIPSKRVQRQMLRLHTVYFRHFFPEYLRVIVCDSDRGLGVMLRHVCSTRMRKVHWRDQVPYAIVEKLEWQEGQGDEEPLLAVSGYLRGRPLSANNLVHISHIGSFQVAICLKGRLWGQPPSSYSVKAVGVRLLAVGNPVEAGVGAWECLWGRVRTLKKKIAVRSKKIFFC